jgi:hypothetical protein
MEQTSMKNINNGQKEERIKCKCGHFLAIRRGRKILIYCKRCKELIEVIPVGGEEAKHTD